MRLMPVLLIPYPSHQRCNVRLSLPMGYAAALVVQGAVGSSLFGIKLSCPRLLPLVDGLDQRAIAFDIAAILFFQLPQHITR